MNYDQEYRLSADFMRGKLLELQERVNCLLDTGASTYYPVITHAGKFSKNKIERFINEFIIEKSKPKESPSISRVYFQMKQMETLKNYMYVIILSSIYNYLDYMEASVMNDSNSRKTKGKKSKVSLEQYIISGECSQAFNLNSKDPKLVFFGMNSFTDHAKNYILPDVDFGFVSGDTLFTLEVASIPSTAGTFSVTSPAYKWYNSRKTNWVKEVYPGINDFMHDQYVESFNKIKDTVNMNADYMKTMMKEKTTAYCAYKDLSLLNEGDEELYIDIYSQYRMILDLIAKKTAQS